MICSNYCGAMVNGGNYGEKIINRSNDCDVYFFYGYLSCKCIC